MSVPGNWKEIALIALAVNVSMNLIFYFATKPSSTAA